MLCCINFAPLLGDKSHSSQEMKTRLHQFTAPFLAFTLFSVACTQQSGEPATAPPAPAPKTPVDSPVAEKPVGPGPSLGDIRSAISSINDDLRQCYIAGTFRDAQLAGTVTVTFTIDTDGTVSEAVDSGSDLSDPQVVDCVVSLFADLEFRPGGNEPTEVTYPIRFHGRG